MKPFAMTALVVFSVGLLTFSAQAEEFPYKAVITGDHVNVRSGPDTMYYKVARLMKGNAVTVVSEEYDWCKIVPPAGSFSWVEKEYVRKASDDVAKVTASRVSVRAGSLLDESKNTAVQVLLGQGAELKVIGEKGNWYKVQPPKGAYVWVSSRFVAAVKVGAKPVKADGDATIKPAVVKKAATTQPRKAATTQPIKIKTAKRKTKTTAAFGEHADTLGKLDEMLKAEVKKPLSQQRWDELRKGYQAIAVQKQNIRAARYAKYRLAVIKFQADNQAGLMELRSLRSAFEAQTSATEQVLIKLKTETLEQEPKIWQGSGVLKVSNVFQGRGMPKRYRLVDVVSNRTTAYVELPKNSDIMIERYLGGHVAVSGNVYFDPKLNVNIIKAAGFKIVGKAK